MSEHIHGVTTIESSGLKQPYHLVEPSIWPIIGAVGGFLIVFGIILAAHFGNYLALMAGVIIVAITMFFWWRDVVRESRTPGLHTPVVRLGLRYGMLFFITREVMFFVGFFWAFFNFALLPDTQGNGQTVWPPTDDPHLRSVPPAIPQYDDPAALGHHDHLGAPRLLSDDRKSLVTGLGLTILLGIAFTSCQAIEYSDAPFKFVGGGVYPSMFFLATGFHGFHVMVGTCFLIVCWFRARAGQFTPERHFGFEAAAWYWHFVDVVWLFLFTCIYWWGASPVTAPH